MSPQPQLRAVLLAYQQKVDQASPLANALQAALMNIHSTLPPIFNIKRDLLGPRRGRNLIWLHRYMQRV